ncbi:carboxymuconolactone decarboxylase family protein [Streptomyces sp. NPDC056656]|uniref:carboxymuconolactone decarboxylase family protein n=1 Tax=Streptomyces sp. NPDC056656 TaxID=3345895 RepID=UPI0036B3001D
MNTGNHKRSPAAPADGADLRALGLETMLSVAAPGRRPGAATPLPPDSPDAALIEIGHVSVWAMLWAREGLGRRERSLVTLGILIALGAEAELASHVRIALNNGLTKPEITEVICHAAGYAGFPRSMAAAKVARQTLDDLPDATPPAKEARTQGDS